MPPAASSGSWPQVACCVPRAVGFKQPRLSRTQLVRSMARALLQGGRCWGGVGHRVGDLTKGGRALRDGGCYLSALFEVV